MKYLRYIFWVINNYIARLLVLIFKGFEKVGIFEEFSREAIASADLGYVSHNYKLQNFGTIYKRLRKYENYPNDYTHGFLKYYLGLMYYFGHVVEENREKAEIFFLQAGELGNEEAMEYLSDKSKKEIKH